MSPTSDVILRDSDSIRAKAYSVVAGSAALEAFDGGRHPVARAAASAGFGPVDQLSMVNVALLVETLTRHPLVEEPHRRGGLDVFGVFYDLPSAAVLRIRPTTIDSLELVSPAPSGGW
jgi:carbonic anhydrase